MGKLLSITAIVAAIVAAILWVMTAPEVLPPSDDFARTGDADHGREVFYAGGCASCHSAPDATGDAKLTLGGGRAFPSPFGTFFAPNISSDPEYGIGDWTGYELANAMKKGVSPDGQHYYPAFPYTSYSRIRNADIIDLHAFLASLPAASTPNLPHDIPLPFRIRRALGLWKWLYQSDTQIFEVPVELRRGQYLVEGLGHCAECHTPRGVLGGPKPALWMSGAPSPDSKGRIPNITSHPDGIGSWSAADIAFYLETGFTPDFDSVGGVMVDVVENTAHMSPEDRLAIAQYLKAIPAITGR